MKFLTAVLAASLALPTLAHAEEPMFSSQDLYKHLGIRGYKWAHEVENPFNKITINLIQYTRNETGQMEKNIISSWTTSKAALWAAGSHPVTAMFDKEKCSLSFLSLNISCADSTDKMWADEDASYCADYPMCLDGEYIFMVKWMDDNVSTDRADMHSYLCMTIETSTENQPSSSGSTTEFH